MDNKLIEIKDLQTYFFTDEATVKALDGVSFDIYRGEVLGVVGESGCGKSVTALSILRILGERGKIVGGNIIFHRDEKEIDLTKLNPKGKEIMEIRGKEISMIFQEPMTSFSPVHTVGNQIMEAMIIHQHLDKKRARERAIEMLRKANIPRPETCVDRYPHQLSGGMRQRAMIAMALSCNPKLLIADEPTTALDVTIQAQILDIMKQLQKESDMSIMMITHNLGVVAETSRNVVIMYLGRIVETATVVQIFNNPLHPYTKALLRSIPRIGKKSGKHLASIEGTVPDASRVPPGCPFHPRCESFMKGICDLKRPEMNTPEPNHTVSCHLYGDNNDYK